MYRTSSRDLREQRLEVRARERLGDDRLDPVLAKRAHQSVTDGDLVQQVDGRDSVNDPLACQAGQPPALVPVLDQLGVGDRAASLAEFRLKGTHTCPRRSRY